MLILICLNVAMYYSEHQRCKLDVSNPAEGIAQGLLHAGIYREQIMPC